MAAYLVCHNCDNKFERGEAPAECPDCDGALYYKIGTSPTDMRNVKDPGMWKTIALEGTIVDFEVEQCPEADNIDIDIITQLINDGIPTIKTDGSKRYYVSFENETVERQNLQQTIKDYLKNDSIIIIVSE